MRNFILFIRRFFNLILFLALEIVCIILISKTNTLQGNDITSSANAVSGLMYRKQNDVVYYFSLGRMNDSLLNENARLRAQLGLYQGKDTLKDSVVQKAIGFTDTSKHIVRYAEYIYRTARVINNSVSAANNYVTINRGADDGIEKNMAVLSGSGIVGKVVHVSSHFASILSVLSVKQEINARLKDGTIGHTSWNDEQPDVLFMNDVPQQIKVKRGDSVFTTSYSYFPQDVLIGTVIKTEPVKKNSMQILYLKSSTNFRNLQYVYVVENKFAVERMQLEDSVKSKKP